MSDMGYGVYVRIQNMDGALWSSNREEWAQTRQDLEVAFGDDFAKALVDSIRKVFVKGGSNVVQLPVPINAPAVQVEVNEEAAMAAAVEAFGIGEYAPASAEVEDQGQAQFEPCDICRTPKTEWRPPGVSKAGKKYPGFFGCPNFRNHPR